MRETEGIFSTGKQSGGLSLRVQLLNLSRSTKNSKIIRKEIRLLILVRLGRMAPGSKRTSGGKVLGVIYYLSTKLKG